jgi:hypothetical protein
VKDYSKILQICKQAFNIQLNERQKIWLYQMVLAYGFDVVKHKIEFVASQPNVKNKMGYLSHALTKGWGDWWSKPQQSKPYSTAPEGYQYWKPSQLTKEDIRRIRGKTQE